MLTRPRPSPPARPSSPARSQSIFVAVFLMVVVALAYGGSFRVPFVYDDILAITENPTLRRLWPLTDVLWPQTEGGLTVAGRPVLNLSLAINYAISGTNVWSYHVFNILVHTASAWLLFGLVRRTAEQWTRSRSMHGVRTAEASAGGPATASFDLGLVVASLWAVHPVQTQAVTYTVQRAESLMAFFYLLTLYGFVRSMENVSSDVNYRRRWFAVSVGACGLGMATKEVMATAPLLTLLYDRTFLAGSLRAAWQARRRYYVGLAATWLVLSAVVLSTGGNRGGTVGIGTGVPLWAYPLTQFEAIARYVGLAFWPHPLVFEYGTFWSRDLAAVLPGALVVLPLLVATLVAWRRSPALGFCGCWFFLILAPTSLAPGTIQMIVEHRMYLPLAAIIAAAAMLVQRCLGRRVLALAAAAAIAFGLLTFRRNEDYRTPLVLWADTVAKRPQNARAHDGLAEALADAGRMDEALLHRREAVRLTPDESRFQYNLAMTLAQTGRREEAVQHYQRSLELDPHEARTHNNLAILFREMGRDHEGLAHYAEAVRLDPAAALFRYNQGVALMRAHRYAEAARTFAAVLELPGRHPDAHFSLATTLVRLGRPEEGLAHYGEALRLNPDHIEYRITYGGALLLARKANDALKEFQRVLKSQPESPEALFGAGNALAALQRTDEAIAHYEAVLRRSPDHAGAHFKMGNALLDLDRVPAAVAHFEAAVKLSPADPEPHHNLGVALARLEKWDDAQREFETALRLNPDYAEARRNLAQLKTLLGR